MTVATSSNIAPFKIETTDEAIEDLHTRLTRSLPLIRSYLSTCRKHHVGMGGALQCLFDGRWPDFIQEKLDAIA